MLKKCNACLKEKSLNLFYVRKKSKDGKNNRCIPCKKSYDKSLRIKNKEKYKEYRKNKKSDINYLFKYRHGFERIEALEILKQQGGCAICHTVLPEEGGHWYLDHDHECCKPNTSCKNCRREILCRDCNLMLGFAKDSIQILNKATQYLEKHNKEKVGNANIQRNGRHRKK